MERNANSTFYTTASVIAAVPHSLELTKKLPDRRGDLVAVGLERKVAGVEETYVGVRHVALERLRTGRQEERIVLAPHCQKRRLVFAKISLEFGIQRDVALVVAEQVELDFIGAGSCQIEVVE